MFRTRQFGSLTQSIPIWIASVTKSESNQLLGIEFLLKMGLRLNMHRDSKEGETDLLFSLCNFKLKFKHFLQTRFGAMRYTLD